MKNKIFCFFLLTTYIFAQPTFITVKPSDANYLITEKILRLQQFLNTGNINQLSVDSLNHIFTKDFLAHKNDSKLPVEENLKDFKLIIQSMEVKKRSASIVVYLTFITEDGQLQSKNVTLILNKEDNWKFSNLGSLDDIIFRSLSNSSKNNPVTDGYNIVQPVISVNTFHQIPLFTPYGEPPIYELNYKKTEEVFNKQLFAANQGLSWAGWYWGPNAYNEYHKLALILDKGWRRIVYSKDDLDGAIRLYDYGRSAGNIEFKSPRSIDMNEFNEIFVADDESNCIYKLNYNYYANTISSPPQPVFISDPNYISKPVDIDYYSGTTYNSRGDDRIVVADEELNCISIFDGNGNYKGKITHFFVSGVGYIPITEPRSAVLFGFQNPYRIAFIDGGTNSLVCGILNENNTSITPLNPPAKFEGYSKLYNIGVDGCYNLLVTDLYGQLIHKFSKDGKYSCSFNQNNQIVSPYFASNVVDNCDYNSHALHFYIGAAWGRNNGITEYLPGADVINLENIDYDSYYKFRFFSTDEIFYTVQLIKTSNNQIISSWNNKLALTASVPFFTQVQDESMPNGEYKWKVTYKPRYDDDYGPYQVGWKVKELYFTHTIVPPIFDPNAPFTQNPDPICKGSSGTVSVNLIQGNGEKTYIWNDEGSLDYFGANFVSHGSYCTVNYPYTAEYFNPMGPIAHLICIVTNTAGSVEATYFLNLNDNCTGCPTLAFENEGELVDENPLLITSLNNPGTDVTDYYLIQTQIVPIGDEINFTIHEPQTEHTWLDQAQLIEAKINLNEYAAVTDDGEIVNYRKPPIPFTITLNDTLNVTALLADLDSTMLDVYEGDILRVEINHQSMVGGGEDNMILGAIEIPPPKQIMGTVSFVNNTGKEKSENSGNGRKFQNFGEFYFRPNMSIICKRLGNLQNGDLEILFNKDAELDYLVIARNLRTARIKSLEILSAVHNTTGDVKSKLLNVDQNYAEIYPGNLIDFTFASTPGNQNKKAYILKTVGRYESDSAYVMKKGNSLTTQQNESIIPKENKLFDNYPNPFNPSTQIRYSIKERGMVRLKVYDALGEVVAELVNKEQPAGTYTVNFNARNLASGIYFYSITTRDFYKVKKMILLK